jgi:hypothetical protein
VVRRYAMTWREESKSAFQYTSDNEALLGDVNRQIEAVEKAPLAERKAGAKKWLGAMSDRPEEVARKVRSLIRGDLGWEWAVKAEQANRPSHNNNVKTNRIAAMGMLVAARVYRCPPDAARRMWSSMTPEQQKRVNQAVADVIKEWEVKHVPERANKPVRGVSGYMINPEASTVKFPARLSR